MMGIIYKCGVCGEQRFALLDFVFDILYPYMSSCQTSKGGSPPFTPLKGEVL